MYCPECGDEKRDEFTICPVCNVPLVEELPTEPEPEYVVFVTVFSSGNQADLLMVKSLLEAAEIQYIVESEYLQDLIGGRFGNNFNPVSGPVGIQVGKDDVEKAHEILKDFVESEPEDSLQEVRELIENLSDEELYEMLVVKPDEYISEAVAVAGEVADKRGGLDVIKSRLGC